MILERLKRETQPLHTLLEQHVDIEQHVQTLPSYRRLLMRFWGFYAPLEALLNERDEWQQHAFDISARQKAALIAADLRALGLPVSQIRMLPCCTALPALPAFADSLGALYVLEGATLGGQIITRQVQRTLGLGASAGCAFFSSYGAQVGPMWRTFQRLLLEVAAEPAIQDRVVSGALATFTAFDHWLYQETTIAAVAD